MADLDAAIRAALTNTKHGDRPDGSMCGYGYGYVCECGLDEKPRAALRAVLDRCNRIDTQGQDHIDSVMRVVAYVIRSDIASALGVPQAEKPQP